MIGIICAMQIEADGILAICENTHQEEKCGMTFTRGTLNGKELVIVVCGVGKVNAAMCATLLINDYSPELVINSGVAGAVSPLVGIGDIVIGKKAVEHDMNTIAIGDKRGEVSLPNGKVTYFECDRAASDLLLSVCEGLGNTRVKQGVIASGDIFVADRRKRLRINDAFGALACEMEGAAIGHVCYCCKTPFAVLRAISDDLDENKGVDFVKFCESSAKKTVFVINGFTARY